MKNILNTNKIFKHDDNMMSTMIYCHLKLLFLLFKNQVQEPYLAVNKSGFLVNPKTGEGLNQGEEFVKVLGPHFSTESTKHILK